MKSRLVAMVIKLLFTLIRYIPVRLAGALGASVGRLGYLVMSKHRSITMTNLTRIYPYKSKSWRLKKAKDTFAELGRTCFEFPHVYLRSKAFLMSRVDIQNQTLLDDAIAQKKGVFLAAAHHSNWELGALMFSMLVTLQPSSTVP